MDIRVLKYFLTVAKEQSISRAAEVLLMTQPPLSRQLLDLETELGKKLFVRSSRRITLTEEGRILRKHAEEIIELTEKAKAEISSLDNDITGEINIAAGETEHFRKLARAAVCLQKEHPKIKVNIFSGNYSDIIDKIDGGLVDFGVMIGVSDIEKYDYLRLPEKDRWGLLITKSHPLGQKTSISPEDINTLPLIVSRQSIANREFISWLKKDGAQLNIVGTYNLLYNAAILAEEGAGGVLCLRGIVPQYSGSKLQFIPLSPEFETSVVLVWKKQRDHSKAAQKFLDLLQKDIIK